MRVMLVVVFEGVNIVVFGSINYFDAYHAHII